MSAAAQLEPGPLGRLREVATRLAPRRADLEAMRRSPRRDLVAGLTVGVVALPLALAFGIASGLGAQAGLVTAVVAGVLAAVFGGSNVQVSGPTGAMTVVLVPIMADYGRDGVLVVGLMAGALLVAMAVARLGRYVRLVPLPVVEGFTLGIAWLIALQQVPAALGVSADSDHVLTAALQALRTFVVDPGWAAPVLTSAVVTLILLGVRFRPSVPGALLAITAATVAAQLGNLAVTEIGALPRGIPAPAVPSLGGLDLRALVIPAIAVAALAALESLLSATVADAMTVAERHDPDRELFGQGVANLASPLFGGVPATAAIARTAVNVRSGAHSRLAAVTHAVVLLVLVLLLAPVVSHIPLAALAGVLIATAVRMVEVSSLRALVRSTGRDAVVLTVTFLATVLLDLATAVVLGIVVASGFALRELARTAGLHAEPLQPHLTGAPTDHTVEEQALLDDHVVAYRLEGPLFFGAAHSALLSLSEVTDTRVVILRMAYVTSLDATGAAVLADVVRRLEAAGVSVLVSGLDPAFRGVLGVSGLDDDLRARGHLFTTTPAAIAHARLHATSHGGVTCSAPSAPASA